MLAILHSFGVERVIFFRFTSLNHGEQAVLLTLPGYETE